MNLPIGKVTPILFEVLELIRYGTKTLLGKELVWFKNLGLANEEVTSLKLSLFFKFFFKKFHEVANEIRVKLFSLCIFLCFDHVEVGYQVFI